MTARNYKKSKIQLVDQLYGEVSVISEKKSISNWIAALKSEQSLFNQTLLNNGQKVFYLPYLKSENSHFLLNSQYYPLVF